MKKRLTRIAPLQTGIVLATLYGILSLIAVPFLLLAGLISGRLGFGVIFIIFLPVLYAAVGFIVGIIAAAVYNLVASWTGGLQFELTDMASPA